MHAEFYCVAVGGDHLSTGALDGKAVESFEQDLSLDGYLQLLGVCYLETGLNGAPLCPGGEDMPVTVENLDDFLDQARSDKSWIRSETSLSKSHTLIAVTHREYSYV